MLTDQDLSDIAWDFHIFSIFFDKLEVQIDGKSFNIGHGLGGLSWTLFERGFDCVMCGKCCRNTHRRIWTWLPSEEVPPEGIRSGVVEAFVNGVKLMLPYHLNLQGALKCDFLKPANFGGQLVEICGIHETHEPVHCKTYPGTAVYPINSSRGKRFMLSRRLPPRNWRWPECPVDVATQPLREQDLKNDRYLWHHWVESFKGIPGSKVELAYSLWETRLELTQKDPDHLKTNIFFEDWV